MGLNTGQAEASLILPWRRHAEHISTEWPASCDAPVNFTAESGLKLILWLCMLSEKTRSTPKSGMMYLDALDCRIASIGFIRDPSCFLMIPLRSLLYKPLHPP